MQITKSCTSPQASSGVAGNSNLICHHCGTMYHQGSMGSHPGHSAQYVVYSRHLCLYVDRRWHTPSTGELYQSDLRAVTLQSTTNPILRNLLDFTNHMQQYCNRIWMWPSCASVVSLQYLYHYPKVKIHLPITKCQKFKSPYLQTVKISNVSSCKSLHESSLLHLVIILVKFF